MASFRQTSEYQTFKVLEHWRPQDRVLLLRELTSSHQKLPLLFSYLYNLAKKEYLKFPRRKNGRDQFTHPLNVVLDLRKAQIEDEATLCAGLIHDLVEERVDVYKRGHHLKDQKDSKELDAYEEKVWVQLEEEILLVCKKNKISSKHVNDLINILHLLTRHKRDFYYRSISQIFTCAKEPYREKAIQIKLADRIHNIQSLDNYREPDMLYQCFKNLFILNNTKRYLQEKYGKKNNPDQGIRPTEKLFKKCCKATYDAFWRVFILTRNKGIQEVESMIHLAFKKYAWEKGGMWQVTAVNPKEMHPIRLFQGIVKKYDARLHQEWEFYGRMKKNEMDYCKRFFADFNFTSKQLEAIIDYKDAYAMKEVVAKLLYDPEYVLEGFGCSALCTRGFKCMQMKK